MAEFVLIFRPTRTTSAEDLPKRNATAREWVVARREDGTLRAACPLEDTGSGALVSTTGVDRVAPDAAIASALIIEAADLEAAIEIAKSYPNLAYGSQIEVRAVRATAPRPVKP